MNDERKPEGRCRFEHYVVQYLLGALPAEREGAIREHMRSCPSCEVICRDSATLELDLASARSQAERLDRLELRALPQVCKGTLRNLIRPELSSGSPEDHLDSCWLCSLLDLYSFRRSRVERGARLSVSDALWYQAIAPSAEFILDRAAAELELEDRPAVASAVAEVLRQCRCSVRWRAAASEVRGFLVSLARDLAGLPRAVSERIGSLGLVFAEHTAAGQLPEVTVVDLATEGRGRLAERGYCLRVADRAGKGAGHRQILVERCDAAIEEWVFLVVRAPGGTYAAEPVTIPKGDLFVRFDVPAEAEGQRWWAEAFVTDRPPQAIDELADRDAREEPTRTRHLSVRSGSQQ
jgi:hypothetical protein